MRTKAGDSRGQAWLGGLSRFLDLSAPAVAILITAFLVVERTPRREPVLYAVLLAALIALTWASARSRGDYGLWALYIGGFAIFSVARSFADETGMPTHVEDLIVAERRVSFGAVPTVWLQQQLFDPRQIDWLDRAATYVHWSYFALPHLFAAHLFLVRRHLFERYVLLFVGVLAAGLALYFIFPAAPPWAASLTGDLDHTYKVVTEVGSELNVNLYLRFEDQIRSSNPIAAMPSIHMAISFVVLLMAFRVSWALGAIALAYNAAMAFSLVYLGEHYVVDIMAGVVVALAVYLALGLWVRRRERRLNAAPAPPQSERPRLEPEPGPGEAEPVPVDVEPASVGSTDISGRPVRSPPAEPGMQT